jgi:hypothetical protein
VAANTSINLVDLDFENLKVSFKNYLKTQDQFKDYDFDGPNLAVLIELLAYNTQKTAFFTNMSYAESYLDSAQLRTSLFSQAKTLNYLPRSVRSASARIRLTWEASGESQPYVIPKGAQFSTLIKSDSFVFSMPETVTVSSANTTFTFESDIYEGIYVKDSYVYQSSLANQRFKITNKNVDMRSVAVTVYEDGSDVGDIYNVTTTLLDLDYKSKVFFVQTSETGHYEVLFGDGVLGRAPKNNALVVIDYRVSRGIAGNGARSFAIGFDPTGNSETTSDPEIEVIESATNGAAEEDNESIRYYAPRHFQVQERVVTPTDYEIALKAAFPEINAISVYGGEDVNPPRMGKVFISVDISNVDGLPESKKNEYFKFIEARSAFGISPIFIEPEFSYLQVKSKVRYNLNITTNSLNRIKTLVTNAIDNHNKVYLNDFNTILRNSQFIADIDDADRSIISNITAIRLYKKLTNPSTSQPTNYLMNFGLQLQNSAAFSFPHFESEGHIVESSPFKFNGEIVTITDNGQGTLYITKTTADGYHIAIKPIGSVNYATGTLILQDFLPDTYDGAAIKFYVQPFDKDIATTQNNILLIELDEVFLDVEGIKA